jgi:hypothetical protein
MKKKHQLRKLSLARETMVDLNALRSSQAGAGTDTRFKTCGDCDTVVVLCGW